MLRIVSGTNVGLFIPDMQHLFFKQKFWPIFWVQFLGACNDNVFKNALVLLITFKSFQLLGLSSEQMVALCGGIFILPFFLFSTYAGQLADKYSKSQLVVVVKIWELLAMLIACIGLISGNLYLLLFTLFFMGAQSAFFGPIKYSILPELIDSSELVAGNAYFSFGTFIAILLGTIFGGILISMDSVYPTGIAVVFLALLGLVISLRLFKLKAVLPELPLKWDVVRPIWDLMRIVSVDRSVFYSVMGISWFWFLGSAILSLIPGYCHLLLEANESFVTFILALFSVGVGAGSMLCERFSFKKLELGLVPWGSLGMTLFLLDLFWLNRPEFAQSPLTISYALTTFEGMRLTFDFFMFSLSGGLFIVPLYTLLQHRGPREVRSRIIAANNVFNALFMVLAALFLIILYRYDLSIPQIFMVLSVFNLLIAAFIYGMHVEFIKCFVSYRFKKRSS